MISYHLSPVSKHGIVQVYEDSTTGHRSLYACQTIKKDSCISPFAAAAVLEAPSYLTIQLADDQHILLQPSFLQYVNHSCKPNAYFDVEKMELVAMENIQAGEQITFFYPSTEWDMAQPFDCHCRQDECFGVIRGAAYLSLEQIKKHRFTSYVRQKIKERG